jgi:hypothetical protein
MSTPRSILAFLACVSGPLAAQADHPRSPMPERPATVRVGTIDGVVSDTNFVPLSGAEIYIFGTRVRVETGESGRFRIRDIPAGQYLVIVRRVGYRPVSGMLEVPPTDTLRLSYTLKGLATTLAPVVVTEHRASLRLAEFEERRRGRVGQFMTEAQIDARNSVFPTELIRTFLSVKMVPGKSSLGGWYAYSARGDKNLRGACPMAVLVDEVQMPTPFNLDMLPSRHDLAGIEVYAGPAQIPPKFNSYDRGCGIILVWTKDGG